MMRELLDEYKLVRGYFHLQGKTLIDIAINELKGYEEDKKYDGEGRGTLDDPYLPSINDGWLKLALKLANSENKKEKTSYLKIAGRLVKYRHQDKYVSDCGNSFLSIEENTIRKILRKKPSGKLPQWVNDCKDRLAFIYMIFGGLLFKLENVGITKVNEILEFCYNLYFLLYYNEKVNITEDRKIIWEVEKKGGRGRRELLFPFNIPKKSAEKVIEKLRRLIPEPLQSPLPTGLLFFVPTENNGKGPDYPKLQRFISDYINYFSMFDEICGDPKAFYRYNISACEKARAILGEEQVNFDDIKYIAHYFPLAVACIFIAETGRNPVSFLTGHILIDLVQKYHQDSLREKKPIKEPGESLSICWYYSWENFFNYSKLNDGYGGLHPMAHKGSYADEFRDNCWAILEEKGETTKTRKKEADLMIRWLQLNVLFNISCLGAVCDYKKTQEEKLGFIKENVREHFSEKIRTSAFMLRDLEKLFKDKNKIEIYQNLSNIGFFNTDHQAARRFEDLSNRGDVTVSEFLYSVKEEIQLKKVKAQVINNQFLIFKRICDLEKNKVYSKELNCLKEEYNINQRDISGLLDHNEMVNIPGIFANV